MQLRNINATREMTFSCKREHLCPQLWGVHECDCAYTQLQCSRQVVLTRRLRDSRFCTQESYEQYIPHFPQALQPAAVAGGTGCCWDLREWEEVIKEMPGATLSPYKARRCCPVSCQTTLLFSCSSNTWASLYQPTAPKEKKWKKQNSHFVTISLQRNNNLTSYPFYW